jgi:THO complex subunit 2
LAYDLLKRCVAGELGTDDAAAFFADLNTNLGSPESFTSQLTDLLSVLDADVSCSESKEQQTTFRALVKAFRPLLGDALLKERLDMDTLEMVGLVASKANFNQRYVKTKTKLFYKQQKFNLFREESEGYSKLVSELGHERRPVEAVPAILDNIRSLIGRFNLDPNRVLDVLMEACSCYHDDAEFFLALLRGYPCEQATFVNILGFKFQSCQSSETSENLFRLAAVLLHEGLVSLTDLYPHLSVGDSTLREFYESSLEDAKMAAKKAMIISLTEKTEEERRKEAEIEKEKQEYRKKILDADANQKLGLLIAAIRLGDWPTSLSLISHLPPLLPSWCSAISQALFQLLHFLLEPLYRMYAPKASKSSSPSLSPELCTPCHQFTDLTPHVFQMLSCVGPSLHSDPILLTKLLRLGRAFFKEHGGCLGRSTAQDDPPSQEIMDVFHGFLTALDEAILPSVSLLSCNCGISEELWSMLKQLPYERRSLFSTSIIIYLMQLS